MAITIKDVAQRAGVSVATASRVLSGGRKVSPELADAYVSRRESSATATMPWPARCDTVAPPRSG